MKLRGVGFTVWVNCPKSTVFFVGASASLMLVSLKALVIREIKKVAVFLELIQRTVGGANKTERRHI